ncbi:MAG: hypothetical protein IKM54_04955, partial [Butyricicoccus sp.]|nr:hypothetical protein [Butyricicoccus sp.]
FKDGTKRITFEDINQELSSERTGSDIECSGAPERHASACLFLWPDENRTTPVRRRVWRSATAAGGTWRGDVRSPAPKQENPNLLLIGDGFGFFVFFERFEETHFRNGVIKRPGSKPGGPILLESQDFCKSARCYKNLSLETSKN